MIIQKVILTKPYTIIDGMNRQPGESGILVLKQDDLAARYFGLKEDSGNIGSVNDWRTYLPRSITTLHWYRDDANCFWRIGDELEGIYPTIKPVFRVDDFYNTLELLHALPTSEILISENEGPWVNYSGPLNIGEVDRPYGYWRAYIPSTPDRTDSPIAYSLPFNAAHIGFDYSLNLTLA